MKKPILIISGDFGVREVYDTDDPLEEYEDNSDREDLEVGDERLGVLTGGGIARVVSRRPLRMPAKNNDK